ncbi:DNA replication and repair protein RecF [Luteolibacter arcticus]|uniref:DNA replication and repair protein RecF n=1 Tax=Luteolibacter arcticus TaxID=1581411 RepID=A0ABT3GI34_9BACT|nr:DNA replication and repair protein RecF [Luteolibacter arcticus]MCW1923170.1 DNA replication and repair protein RecF [Luteolibacter arcticus]
MIRTLRAVDFRCFSGLALEIPEGGALFTGDNAQGKTSILEAVCVLVRLHSPRTRKMPAMARMGGAGGFGVAGEAWEQERRVRWQKAFELTVDGEARDGSGSYLADGGLIVWMGNEDLELVRGSAETRRHYLDFMGSQLEPGYRTALARYRRALKAKNLLLKDPRPREDEIRSYEEVMISEGTLLVEARSRLVELISPRAAASQREVSGKEELLAIEYRPAGGHDLRLALEQARDRERRQRQSFVGPHRDDLLLSINGLPAGEFASEGQQRTLALSLKLAQGEALAAVRGSLPVYLIDDVFGELDPSRRNAVLRVLPTVAQKWITTTHLGWLDESAGLEGMARFAVKAGSIATA